MVEPAKKEDDDKILEEWKRLEVEAEENRNPKLHHGRDPRFQECGGGEGLPGKDDRQAQVSGSGCEESSQRRSWRDEGDKEMVP